MRFRKEEFPLLGVTVNRGDHVGSEEILDVLFGPNGACVDFAVLQEMFDSQHILRALKREGLSVWKGNRPASQASPVVWNPRRLKALRKGTVALLPAGKRNGKFNMAKSFNWVLVKDRITGARFFIVSFHQIQTVGPATRNAAARHAVGVLHDWASAQKHPVIAGGDWNAELDPDLATDAERRVLAPMRGWRWEQKNGRIPKTRLNRSIDGFAVFAAQQVLQLSQMWVGPASWDGKIVDHVPLYCRWMLRRKKKEKR